ncbi:NAD(P)-dependent dehydrogenase (short-subunit alcohol dehydrogenase family) [Paenibacillus shirakamiensis]|uniref:NAD(P)-dependent dehydrogenase (Short-subunit alcohol dehydrogenase family) n=1 Tax=Paenibacillus shirakamiensis TaxID=1265935 RepID=A0ABS4JG96_9BACL|nr:SDR family NAD(P)-dependent oxidoreductase [Paenibacillus shirakamiensis]MBP2000735.1 NAD(P)-dependent dehydrogenase (short-subunit alcohol dehydrogenase family) [Paenibacillus shirakamiensis]
MPDQRIGGKIAVVTGGGSGIGQAAAIRFAEEGATVYMLDRTPEKAEATRATIENNGGVAHVVECDISKPEMVEKAFQQVAEQAGKLDIVFANAGINGTMAPIETMEIEDWDRTININLRGTFATVKYAIPHLKDRGGSIIINSSINGNRVFSNIGFSAYSSTKAAQVAFMKMAALELARYKIRVNAICPGAIKTHIDENTYPTDDLKNVQIKVEFPDGDQPLEQGPGTPTQVANVVLFLASDESSHLTGTEIFVDGAESLLHG